MTTVLTLMSTACLTFTGTANTMEVFHSQGKVDRAPSVETCIQWEMKLGVYKLTRPKESADDWVWIVDHVVSKGIYKCLVVLGVRMSVLSKKDDLTIECEDVEPLAIVPMRESNGELVEAEFEKILKRNNDIPPLAIIKDEGSDLRRGGRLFCEKHPDVISIYDITHKIARLYKHRLKEDEVWEKFTKKCAHFKKQVQLTKYAKLAPPNQRSKARYHNIDVLVDWGNKKLADYDALPREAQEKLSWLKEYESEIALWSQFVEVGRVSRDFVRREGLYVDSYEHLENRLVEMELFPEVDEFACELISFVEEEGNKVPKDKTVIGSSEIIESLFGKHKNIAGRGPNPIGRLILAMASRVGERPTEDLVQTAFEQTKEKDVHLWLEEAFQ